VGRVTLIDTQLQVGGEARHVDTLKPFQRFSLQQRKLSKRLEGRYVGRGTLLKKGVNERPLTTEVRVGL
jgi:hypothetical protein